MEDKTFELQHYKLKTMLQ